MKQMGHSMATRAATTGKSTGGSAKPKAQDSAAKPARAPAKPTAPAKPARAPAAPVKPAAKPEGAAAQTASQGMTKTPPVEGLAVLKKKELVDSVVKRSGVKKKFAKPAVEAMIDLLGEALAEGRELHLQPFGKIKQHRSKESGNARVIMAKIRQSKSAAPALDPEDRADAEFSKETLAKSSEEG